MKTATTKLIITGITLAGVCWLQAASEWYVAQEGADQNDGLSWSSAKRTIQAAIDAAAEGDTITVGDGVYEPIVTDGKLLVINSFNGAAATSIDGANEQRCAYLGWNRSTTLSGFTLFNGFAEDDYGGGVYGGTVLSCIISNCAAYYGGGASYSYLEKSLLIENSAEHGGGAVDCEIVACEIRANRAFDGGGISYCTVRRSKIADNQAEYGGGAESSELSGCLLLNNSADEWGGGADWCEIFNCTIVNNRAKYGGGAAGGALFNTIVWQNEASEAGDNLYDTVCSYVCSSPLESGEGNICADPQLVDIHNEDLRLRVGSPCIDSGDDDYVVDEEDFAGGERIVGSAVDMGAHEGSGVAGYVISVRVKGYGAVEPRTALTLAGGSAYFTAEERGRTFVRFLTNGVEASTSPTFTWPDVQADGVLTAEFAPCTIYIDAASADDSGDGLSWSAAKRTLQGGVDMALPYDQIVVTNGLYAPFASYNLLFTIQSVEGREMTIIDGGGTERCATLGASANHTNTFLSGFTLRNGLAVNGGGSIGGSISNCLYVNNRALASGGGAIYGRVSDSVFSENSALADAEEQGGGVVNRGVKPLANGVEVGNGGALAFSVASDCTLSGNVAVYGGGAYKSTLKSCMLTRNQAMGEQGGVVSKVSLSAPQLQGFYSFGYGGGACGGTLIECNLSENSAGYGGGGAYDATLERCELFNNLAQYGGGAYECALRQCRLHENAAWNSGGGAFGGTLESCALYGNASVVDGGGSHYANMVNCTLVGNRAGMAGGGAQNSGLDNCIVWGNSAVDMPDVAYCWGANNCFGEGEYDDDNIINDNPLFVDAINGDFRLRSGSPCLDAGDNELVEGESDLDGNARIQGDVVDLGAIEGAGVAGFVISTRVVGGGLITPRTAVVAAGGSASFNALVGDRAFVRFLTNGVEASTSPTFVWQNLQADGILTAEFVRMTIHADASRPDDSGDGLSWGTAKRTLQGAIDVAWQGETVLAADGNYAPITTLFKTLTIRSVNGAGETIIDGLGSERCATLGLFRDDSASLMQGFTLRNGGAVNGGGAFYGTLRECVLRDNYAGNSGGGAHGTRLQQCVVEGNRAGNVGGGTYEARLEECLLSGNQAIDGGGAYISEMVACRLTANIAHNYGGGAYYSHLESCTLWDNRARDGGGAFDCTLINCSLAANRAEYGGGASHGELYNSIVWDNQATEEGDNILWEDECHYTCSTPLPDGAGNIDADPRLVDSVNGDFRLRVNSPCIDAGDNASVIGATDLSGGARILDDTVDMGACEGSGVEGFVISARISGRGDVVPRTAVVAAGGSAMFTATLKGRPFVRFLTNGVEATTSPIFTWSDINADGTLTAEFAKAVIHVDAAQVDDSGDGLSWLTAKRTLQAAIDCAYEDETVLAAAGEYEPIVCEQKRLTITSQNGAAATIIDADFQQRCALLGNNVTLSGFTLRHGFVYYEDGGGVFGGILNECRLVDNEARYDCGGAAAYSVLNGCTLEGNRANIGGGAYYSSLTNCVLQGNSADSGGGAYQSSLTNCVLQGNSADSGSGGGAYYSSLINCVLQGNSADSGGGAYESTLHSSQIVGNSAEWEGGGTRGGSLYNCTVVDNYCDLYGGGCLFSYLYNSIVWGNTASEDNNCSYVQATYTCTTPLEPGEGNFAADPLFVASDLGDYRLQESSPCIDAGSNSYVEFDTDLAGGIRIVNGTVDLGAFEVATVLTRLPLAWLTQYGLATDGSADDLDTDGDGYTNWEEWVVGTDPTNALSRFGATIKEFEGTLMLHWQPDLTNATPARLYSIYGTQDLQLGFPSQPTTNLPAATPIPLDALAPLRFFRIGVTVD